MTTLYTAWKDLAAEANEDGFVCDIVIADTTITDWSFFFRFLSKFRLMPSYWGTSTQQLPEALDDSFFDESKFIALEVEGLRIECIVSDPQEIELFVRPPSITTMPQITSFFNFVADLGLFLKKEVALRVEGSKRPSIRFSPVSNSFSTGKGGWLER